MGFEVIVKEIENEFHVVLSDNHIGAFRERSEDGESKEVVRFCGIPGDKFFGLLRDRWTFSAIPFVVEIKCGLFDG